MPSNNKPSKSKFKPSSFWDGFYLRKREKKLPSDPLDAWTAEASDDDFHKSNIQKPIRIDPVEAAVDHTPDATYRYWP